MAALGGNALLTRGERPDASLQLHHVEEAAAALAPLARDHQLLICHGNGPQVGLLSRESEADTALSEPYPLDVLGAQTQGMIGYWLCQSLLNAGVRPPPVGVLSQTLVHADDPAFTDPTKFIGPTYAAEHVEQLKTEHSWSMRQDGATWRRVVASPEPIRLVEEQVIEELLGQGHVVICAGGGGAPVTLDAENRLRGADAVVDKDYVAAMLAITVRADLLLLLTDVTAVMSDFGTPEAVAIPKLTLADIAGMTLPPGSMGPKVEACRRFVAATGKSATIGSMHDVADLVAGRAGTTVGWVDQRG